VPVAELILRRLLPIAHEGLDRWGIEPGERDRLLGIVEQRCLTGSNGSTWQMAALRHFENQEGLSRPEALRRALQLYITHMHSNAPVHEWPVP
jgi:hypothetical protein